MNYVRIIFLTVVAFLVSCSSSAPGPDLELTVIRLAPTEANLFDDTSEDFIGQAVLDPKSKEIIRDSEALDGFAAALYRTGEGAKFSLEDNFASGTYAVSMRARAHDFEGPPIARVSVSGQQISTDTSVEFSEYAEKEFGEVYLEAGQTVEVVFTNDNYIERGRDRNLFVDHLTLTPVEAPAAEPEEETLDEETADEDTDAPPPSEASNELTAWSDPATWGGSVPAAGDTVEISADQSILLDVSPPALGGLRVEGDLIFDNKDLELSSDWIIVEGLLQAGTPSSPYTNQATITLTGDDPNALTPFGAGVGVKVLGVLGEGSLELHGEARTSWSRLGATAEAGATSITLADASDWRAGESVAIASTDYDFEQAEERVISAVNGNTLSFETPLEYTHFGDLQEFGGKTLDQRAEVGLLSRNIVIQGDESSAGSGFGGHIIARDQANMSLSNIELTQMGQRGILGRYPVHWHMMGDGSRGSYIKNSSLHNLPSRCVTIHGSNGVTVESNVAYDAVGHCYFLEDGAEIDNVLRNNLGLVTRMPEDSDALLASDQQKVGPATYWITHPNNIVEGNVAAGSEGTGFWYALPEHPTGESAEANQDVFNRYAPLGVFKGNKAHSSRVDGFHIDAGPSGDADGSIEVSAYEPRTNPEDPDTSVTATFEDFTGYKNRSRGFWSRGFNNVFDNFMLADNQIGSIMASNQSIVRNSVYVGESANKGTPNDFFKGQGSVGVDGRSLPRPGEPNQDIFGFGFYDGTVGIENSYLTNYTSNELRTAGALSVEHFTPFTLNRTNYAEGVTFGSNTQRVNLPVFEYVPGSDELTGDSYRTAVFIDVDGSVTGGAGADVVADNPFLLNGNCELRDNMMGVRVCQGNDYGDFRIDLVNTERSSVTLSLDGNDQRMYGVPKSPSNSFRSSLLANQRYTMDVEGGLPSQFTIQYGRSEGTYIELSVPGSVSSASARGVGQIEPAASLEAMRNSSTTSYYQASGTLHMKIFSDSFFRSE